jgi:hypothetical protein
MRDMKPVVLGFVALAASIIAFNIWARERWVRLALGSALLLSSYLVLQFSWDLLHMDTRGYEGTAPGPGALAFLFGPVGFIFGIVAIVLLATSRRAVLRRFVALAAAPCLVAMVYYVPESIKSARLQEIRNNMLTQDNHITEFDVGAAWARTQHLASNQDCRSQFRDASREFEQGCLKYLQTIYTTGQDWAWTHHIFRPADCKAAAEGFEQQPMFVVGCMDGARDRH